MIEARELRKYYTQVYSSIRSRSKRRGEICLISKSDLIIWLLSKGVKKKYLAYIRSGYDKNKKPSIDRIDDFKGYFFENMQLITWGQNQLKGCNGEKHHMSSSQFNKAMFSKKVYRYNKHGEFIALYNSAADAAIAMGCYYETMVRVAGGDKKRKTIKGEHFSYSPMSKSDFDKKSEHGLRRPVLQMNLNGRIIKKWNGICLAAKALSLSPSSISAVCVGRINQTGGFGWSYALTGKELTPALTDK